MSSLPFEAISDNFFDKELDELGWNDLEMLEYWPILMLK